MRSQGIFGRIADAVGDFTRRVSRRSVTVAPISYSDSIMDWGGPTTSGLRVTPDTALTYSPVWRAVTLISSYVAKVPLFVYARDDDGKARAPDHPAYRLLRRKPNSEMVSYVFRQVMQANALLWGNAMAFIYRRGDGSPDEILPLRPESCWPVRENGTLYYCYMPSDGAIRRLLPEDVLHLKGLGTDGLGGLPLWKYARNSFGGGMAAQEYGARFFANDSTPRVVITHPKQMSEAAVKRLRESWFSAHQGLEKAHKPAILEEAATVTPISNSPEEAQLLELRQFEIREVANWFGLPPHKLGDTTRTAFASLEQENQSFLDDALDPWLVQWEEECGDKLLTERQKTEDTHFVEFERKALVRADLKARAEYYTKATGGAPWMLVDEVRRAESMNDLPDGQGQKYIRPLNMTDGTDPSEPADTTDQEDDATEMEDDATDSARQLLLDTATRMAKRIKSHPTYHDHKDVTTKALAPAIRVYAAVAKRKADVDALVASFIANPNPETLIGAI